MDPSVCYQEMSDAIEEADRLLLIARERAIALNDWLMKGGCHPVGVTESQVRNMINQVFLRTEEADDA